MENKTIYNSEADDTSIADEQYTIILQYIQDTILRQRQKYTNTLHAVQKEEETTKELQDARSTIERINSTVLIKPRIQIHNIKIFLEILRSIPIWDTTPQIDSYFEELKQGFLGSSQSSIECYNRPRSPTVDELYDDNTSIKNSEIQVAIHRRLELVNSLLEAVLQRLVLDSSTVEEAETAALLQGEGYSTLFENLQGGITEILDTHAITNIPIKNTLEFLIKSIENVLSNTKVYNIDIVYRFIQILNAATPLLSNAVLVALTQCIHKNIIAKESTLNEQQCKFAEIALQIWRYIDTIVYQCPIINQLLDEFQSTWQNSLRMSWYTVVDMRKNNTKLSSKNFKSLYILLTLADGTSIPRTEILNIQREIIYIWDHHRCGINLENKALEIPMKQVLEKEYPWISKRVMEN